MEKENRCDIPLVKEKTKKKKLAPGICDFCGEESSLCYICTHCGFTVCQRCFIEHQRLFTRTGVTWVCPNCLNWETL